MVLQCAFCNLGFKNQADVYNHTSHHSEDTLNSVPMSIGDQVLLLTLDHPSGLYACPKQCNVKGTLGSVWVHYMANHNRSSTKRSFNGDQNDRPTKIARFGPMSSSDKSSPSPPPGSSPPASSFSTSSGSSATLSLSPIRVDLDLLFGQPELTSVDEIFAFINQTLSDLYDSCAYHQIMQGTHASDHSLMRVCTDSAVCSGSEYYEKFTTSLNFAKYIICYRCYTPQHRVFNHDPKQCYGRGNIQDWWRGIAYLVFRTQELRITLFSALGIHPDGFPTLDEYCKWLVLEAIPRSDRRRNNRFTNLAAIVFVYFLYFTQGTLTVPEGGYELDGNASHWSLLISSLIINFQKLHLCDDGIIQNAYQ
ncbi:hypothetical protein F5890DRAFT_1556361 [Lentinula detonsa]|uniref:C2H2-type domain-containing protein n=1 Tax=Lentinula detonsa TaxID=2804962 RepID=A0AA38UQ90_9AGAR|nr:hypothetical protein F5890DRAFT_1556361 [Lentinula detonsa]